MPTLQEWGWDARRCSAGACVRVCVCVCVCGWLGEVEGPGLIIAPSACCVWGGVGASAVLPGMRSRRVLLLFPNPRLPFHLRLNIIAITCQPPPSYLHTAAWIICPRAWSHLPASWTEWRSTMPATRWRGGARCRGRCRSCWASGGQR
jgi:hypothetical protein